MAPTIRESAISPRSRCCSSWAALKSLASGPASLVIEGLPNIIDKGLRALGDIFDDEEEESAADALSREPPAPPFES